MPLMILFALLLVWPTPVRSHAPYRVATAASFKPVLDALLKAYPDGRKWQVMAASSGKMASQIIHGAAIPIFLSADENRAYAVQKQLGLPPSAVFRYAGGRLGAYTGVHGQLADCPAIAIANPRHAPYGRAAQQVLTSRAITVRQVMGQNVAQVAQFLKTGAAPCGLLALSYRPLFAKGALRAISPSEHSPLWQAGVVVAKGKAEAVAKGMVEAEALRAFILSPKGQAIVKSFDLAVPEGDAKAHKKPCPQGSATSPC